ncbi:MAG: YbjQ family protein [Spirochaetales bacterium]|nr:YbjQ family protein [Spirochaetales bacterium]
MIIVTTPEVPGKKIVRVLGLARGNTIRARHIGRDIAAVFKNIVGGEISDYTKMMSEAREQALDRLSEDAAQLGANAVVQVRFSTTSMMQGAAEFMAYGTAVVVE